MKSYKPVILIICISMAIIAIFYMPLFIIRTSMTSAGDVAQQLLAKAGGAARVCKEADQIFQRYGVTNQTIFHDEMLSDYPAITSVGKVDYIMPDKPPYIKIRVGTHLDGYIIQIVDTNGNYEFRRGPDALEVVKDRMYIHR